MSTARDAAANKAIIDAIRARPNSTADELWQEALTAREKTVIEDVSILLTRIEILRHRGFVVVSGTRICRATRVVSDTFSVPKEQDGWLFDATA